jgi:hypothetical protein
LSSLFLFLWLDCKIGDEDIRRKGEEKTREREMLSKCKIKANKTFYSISKFHANEDDDDGDWILFCVEM